MMVILLVAGFILLVIGAEALVRGASKLAAAFGISPLVIGLTVVAFGTSAPEMAVSAISAIGGNADISLGNVVGSNIFNTLFILGISSLVAPLVVSQQLVRMDVPVMITISVLAFLLGMDGIISRMEGTLLFGAMIAYTVFLIRQSRKEKKQVRDEYAQEYAEKNGSSLKSLVTDIMLISAGLGMLVLGSKWLVAGAVFMARHFGISQLVIGLTIVAIGTSLPELATSVVASIRGERDIAVGNVVGSNLFNILAVLGLAGMVSPRGIHVPADALRFDIPVMIAAAVACLPIFFTGNLIARWEGALFLGYYVAYMICLVFSATRNGSMHFFSMAMIWFVIPLTVLTIAIVVIREIRRKNAGRVSP